MKKLKYLIKYALKKRIYSKAFVISNVFIGLVVLGIMLVPTLINTFSSVTTVKDTIRIVNTSDYNTADKNLSLYVSSYFDQFVEQLGFENELKYQYETSILQTDLDNYYESSHDEQILIYIYQELISPNLNPEDKNNYILKASFYNNNLNQSLATVINQSLSGLNRSKYILDNEVSPTLVADLIPNRVDNPNNSNTGTNEILMGIAPIVVVPLFIIITFAVQVIGAEIIEEKSTKAIEIIIASVKPTTHFIAKVASIIIFQVIQMALMFIIGIFGLLINSIISSGSNSGGQSWDTILSMLEIDIVPVLAIVVVCTLLGAMLYSVVGALLGALSVNQEDYQQVQTPVMLVMMVAYLGTMFFALANNQTMLLVFNYVPFFSPLAMPISFLLGHIGLLEIAIGLTILVASIILAVIIIAPLYKASILSYDQSKLVKRVKNAYKNAKALKENKRLYEENNTDAS